MPPEEAVRPTPYLTPSALGIFEIVLWRFFALLNVETEAERNGLVVLNGRRLDNETDKLSDSTDDWFAS
jgi:hypothetical protein